MKIVECDGRKMREKGRLARGKIEYKKMVSRYWAECGVCVTVHPNTTKTADDEVNLHGTDFKSNGDEAYGDSDNSDRLNER